MFDYYWPASWSSEKVEGYLMTARNTLVDKGMLSVTSATPGLPKILLDIGKVFSHKHPLGAEDTSDMSYERYEAISQEGVETEDEQGEIYENRLPLWSQPSQARYYTTCNGAGLRARLSNILNNHNGDGKLTLKCNSRVAFVVFEGTRAVGVAVHRKESTASAARGAETAEANPAAPFARSGRGYEGVEAKEEQSEFDIVYPSGGGEIILCCGAIESPKVLIASGLRGAVLAHPASKCGRIASSQSRATAKTKGKDKGKIKTSSGYERTEGTSTPVATSASHLPNLIGIGSNLQDHVVVPVLALGMWHSFSEVHRHSYRMQVRTWKKLVTLIPYVLTREGDKVWY